MPVQDFILAEVVGSIPHYKQTPFSSSLEIITILKKVVKERLMPQINFDRYNFTIASNDRIMLSINQIIELPNLPQANNDIHNQNEVRSDNEKVNASKTGTEATLDNPIQDKITVETNDSTKDLKKKATFADKVLEHCETMKTGVKNKPIEKTNVLRENESVEALNKDESKVVNNEEKIANNLDIKSKEESGQKKFKFTSNPLFEMNFKPTLTTLETPLTNEQLEMIYNGLGSTYDYLSTSLNTLISTDKSLNNLLTPTVPEKKKDSLQSKSDKLMVLLLKKEEEEAIYQYFEVDASKSELLLKNNKFRKDVKMFRIDALKILAVYEAIASTFQNILMIEIF
ncbi:hypothetical protein K502DRAFT_10208 [Neoconidiobolus thromboides FSU 785]|nr:hypothetical protein K502DRAFT_10208 [Neoconidiobolus thromboides FSU 785]